MISDQVTSTTYTFIYFNYDNHNGGIINLHITQTK